MPLGTLHALANVAPEVRHGGLHGLPAASWQRLDQGRSGPAASPRPVWRRRSRDEETRNGCKAIRVLLEAHGR